MTSRWRPPTSLAALALLLPALAVAQPTWVRAPRGAIPAGAFVAGDQVSRTVLCRAKFRGGVHPGKVMGNRCFVTYRNVELGLPEFEVLVGVERPGWIPVEGGRLPPDAYAGGQDGGRTFYVCRGPALGMIHPGKLVGNACSVSANGKEFLLPRYEVLVVNAPPPAPPPPPVVMVTGTPDAPPPPAYPQQPSYPPPAYPQQPPPGYGQPMPMPARWVDASSPQLPPAAFAAGEENGRPIYLCRAPYEGGWHPGKLVGSGCNFGYHGQELAAPRFQLLTNVGQSQWVPGEGRPPQGAFVGGIENGRGLVVCRGPFSGGLYPGRLVGRSCRIGLGGQEVELTRYEILMAAPVPGDAYAGPLVADNDPFGRLPPPVVMPAVPRWVDAANGVNPAGAFAAGDEGGRPVVLCRGQSLGSWYPGRVTPTGCSFAAEGQELASAQYQVLTSLAQPQWVAATAEGGPTSGAFLGGVANGRPHAVCRAPFNNGTYPGFATRRGCSIGLGGQAIVLPRFEVLVAPAIADDPVLAGLAPAANPWGNNTTTASAPPAYPQATTASAVPARWVDTEGGANPAGAFVAGQENGKNLVLCRASYGSGVQPGKVVGNGCNFGWGGTEMIAPKYQVLANLPASQWMAASDGYVPPGAFVGGSENGRGLVICRASVNGGVHPGKVVGANCNVGWGGREMQVNRYEVLVAPAVP